MTNLPPPDYDHAVGAHLAPQHSSPSSPGAPGGPPTPPRSPRQRILGVVAALVLVLTPAIVGYQIGRNNDSSPTAGTTLTLPASDGQSDTPSNGSSASPSTGSGSSGSAGSGTTSSIDIEAIADKVDDSVLNINTTLATGGAAAGTGILISQQGLALTNNHVIADSTAIRAEVAATGRTYSATVLGYNIVADVAVIQLEDASGLKPADLGDSADLMIGDTIVALGNAGGRGGQPTVVSGAVTALDQEITASESDGSNVQTLSDLIQVNANIQSGDSGGPLVDGTGAVVGMNAAASSRNGLGGFPSAGGQNQGYAIPIEKALAIAKKIISKEGGTDIHVGANRAVIGVSVQDDSASVNRGGGLGRLGNGAQVVGVEGDSGADKAGITEGSTITAVDGNAVSSASALTRVMVQYQPGDSVEITWIDANGQTKRATVKLGSGPPA